jgi:hypothetical protein
MAVLESRANWQGASQVAAQANAADQSGFNLKMRAPSQCCDGWTNWVRQKLRAILASLVSAQSNNGYVHYAHHLEHENSDRRQGMLT